MWWARAESRCGERVLTKYLYNLHCANDQWHLWTVNNVAANCVCTTKSIQIYILSYQFNDIPFLCPFIICTLIALPKIDLQLNIGQRLEASGFKASNCSRTDERDGNFFYYVVMSKGPHKFGSCWVSRATLGQMRSGRELISAWRTCNVTALQPAPQTININNNNSNNSSNINNSNNNNNNNSTNNYNNNNSNINNKYLDSYADYNPTTNSSTLLATTVTSVVSRSVMNCHFFRITIIIQTVRSQWHKWQTVAQVLAVMPDSIIWLFLLAASQVCVQWSRVYVLTWLFHRWLIEWLHRLTLPRRQCHVKHGKTPAQYRDMW